MKSIRHIPSGTGRLILAFALLLAAKQLVSQQTAQQTQYMFSRNVINPGATASSGCLDVQIAGRYQWIGFEDDSNQTGGLKGGFLDLEIPLLQIKSAIGITLSYDQTGYENNSSLSINYALRLPFRDIHEIGAGLSLDLLSKSVDFSQFQFYDPGDPLITGAGKESGLFTDLGLGMEYVLKERLYVGASVKHLLGASADIGNLEYDFVRHYYFMAGYDFRLTQDSSSRLVLSTGVLVNATSAAAGAELHALLRYDGRYWAGLMYRWNDAVGIMAGLRVRSFSIGLSYDISIGGMAGAGSLGSPELLIGYCHPLRQKEKLKH